MVLVYKYGQEKLNNLYYQVKEQREMFSMAKTKNPILWNSSSRSWFCTMPEKPRIQNWNVEWRKSKHTQQLGKAAFSNQSV